MLQLSLTVSAIYQIKCLTNNTIYIGSTVNFRNRWSQHQNYLQSGTHQNRYLPAAWNKYGFQLYQATLESSEPGRMLFLAVDDDWRNYDKRLSVKPSSLKTRKIAIILYFKRRKNKKYVAF